MNGHCEAVLIERIDRKSPREPLVDEGCRPARRAWLDDKLLCMQYMIYQLFCPWPELIDVVRRTIDNNCSQLRYSVPFFI
jgi:hypothetical protein